jgi:hypothetical protein
LSLLVLVNQHLRVVTKYVAAVIFDPAAEPTERMATVHRFALVGVPDLLQASAIC